MYLFLMTQLAIIKKVRLHLSFVICFNLLHPCFIFSLVFSFSLSKLLFSGFLQFKANFITQYIVNESFTWY